MGLFYSARTPAEFAYEAELRGMAERGQIELRQTVTRDVGEAPWTGRRGRIDATELASLVHDPETLCFICGPPALVQEMPPLLAALGIDAPHIRVEEWG